MDAEKIGKIIRQIRMDNNLTQRDFAEMFLVSAQAVSKWEMGSSIPDIMILKEICNTFNIDLNELLNGDVSLYKVKPIKKNRKKWHIIIAVLSAVVVAILTFFFIDKFNNNYKFENITSACEDFKISGVAAYDSKKSSLYISKIDYCGAENKEIYKNISCTLYESYNDTIKKIAACEEGENVTLDDYLKNLEIRAENYSSICKDFNSANIYLEIQANSGNTLVYTHKIPLTIKEQC